MFMIENQRDDGSWGYWINRPFPDRAAAETQLQRILDQAKEWNHVPLPQMRITEISLEEAQRWQLVRALRRLSLSSSRAFLENLARFGRVDAQELYRVLRVTVGYADIDHDLFKQTIPDAEKHLPAATPKPDLACCPAV